MKKIHYKNLSFPLVFALFIGIALPVAWTAVALAAPSSVGGSAAGGMNLDRFYEKYFNPIIYALSVLAGIAVIAGLTWGGIQYGMSGGDPQKVTQGKATIQKALLGLVAFFLLAPFLNFLSPGGIAGSSGSTAEACNSKTMFLALKPWYAYIPSSEFDSVAKNCQLKADARIMPYSDGSTRKPGLLPVIMIAIVDNMLRIAALVAVAFTIVGGVKYMTSQGNPDQTRQALSSIINALIGLAIAVIAAAVVSYLGKRLTN